MSDISLTCETLHFRGGAPPYRGFHPSGTHTVLVPRTANYAEIIDRVRQSIDPFNERDVFFELRTNPHHNGNSEVELEDGRDVFGYYLEPQPTNEKDVGGGIVDATSDDTAESLFENRGLRLLIYIPMRRGCVDIGVFGNCIYSPGANYILDHNSAQQHVLEMGEQAQAFRKLMERFHANPKSCVVTQDTVRDWEPIYYLQCLVDYLERRYQTKWNHDTIDSSLNNSNLSDYEQSSTRQDTKFTVSLKQVREALLTSCCSHNETSGSSDVENHQTKVKELLQHLLDAFNNARVHPFSTPVSWDDVEIVLRRVTCEEGVAKENMFIPFHVDYAFKTLQMRLNDDYKGGNLLYINEEEGCDASIKVFLNMTSEAYKFSSQDIMF